MSRPLLTALGASVLVVAVATVAFRAITHEGAGEAEPRRTLICYCAAGLKQPIEAALREYQSAYPVTVETQFDGSGTLLANLAASRRGDLFIAAEQSYVDQAVERGLAGEHWPVALQSPVIAVPRGNPRGIRSLEALRDASLRIGLANPEAAAIGRTSRELLERAGLWAEVKQAVEAHGVFKPNVAYLANDLSLGAIDVAILWDATVAQDARLEAVPIEAFVAPPERITLAVLTSSADPRLATHLARYLVAADGGLVRFREFGYRVVDAEPWNHESLP